MNTIKDVNKSLCMGCHACFNACPVGAITMKENSEGFLFPHIDDSKCVKCGICVEKCAAISPVYRNENNPTIFAACANDEVRMESSSGGIFTVLAESVLNRNGVVCGAKFDEEFLNVEHCVIDNIEDLKALKGSKYVQSAIGDSYKKIENELKKGRYVLFTGTGCQVAGLNAYLGKEYSNLITVDILCHGVPSPKAYKKFVNSVVKESFPNEKLVDFQFRSKEHGGWAPSLYAKLSNGAEYSKRKMENSWYPSFLNILNCRECCGDCKFNKLPRQGDITLGDFWGIDTMPNGWNDGKGASVITINTEKGKAMIEAIQPELIKCDEITLDMAKKNNGNLVASSRSHKFRKRFFELLNMYDSYDKITEYSLKRKFDIGYVGWWYGKNYGSVMTNFALEQYIESLGYSVLMLEWPEKEKPVGEVADSFARRFGKKYYEIGMRRAYWQLPELNWFCDSFLVGSDQLWNYWSTADNGGYFFLDFVEDSRKKIAYATSFGHPIYGAPRHILETNSFHLNRFDAISVREKDGIDICRDTFGVDAQWTIEPVFLLDKERYINIANDSNVDTPDKYLFAYILSPSKEKREAIINLAKEKDLEVILVLDAQANHEENRNIMDMPEALKEELEMEDWLKYIYNAEYVVTDSFHGTCFSMIYEKNFVCIGNIKRGISRFNTLLECSGLLNRMVLDPKEIVKDELKDNIDYSEVKFKMTPIIDSSKEWLKNALSKNKPYKSSTYDILLKRIKSLEDRVNELSKG